MAIMKSRHAAALALTFWLLMIPPVQQGGRGDFNAPIKSWRPVQLFGSLPECDQTRQATIAFGANKQGKEVFEKILKAHPDRNFLTPRVPWRRTRNAFRPTIRASIQIQPVLFPKPTIKGLSRPVPRSGAWLTHNREFHKKLTRLQDFSRFDDHSKKAA